MRYIALLILTLIWISALPIRAQNPESDLYWVFFSDSELGRVIDDGRASDRALQRRAMRGRGSSTAVIRLEHVETLTRLGAAVRVRSDLLGAVSARMTAEVAGVVEKLSIVDRVVPLRPPREDRPKPSFEPLPASKAADDTAGLSTEVLARINALEPLARGINGSGVIIGFLDTQYDGFQHPAFAQHQLEGRILGIEDFVGLPQHNLHGLQVASVATGREDGRYLSPGHGASILAATTEYVPTETHAEEEYFVAGLEWLEANGVDVMNVSLGYTTFDDGGYEYADLDGATAVTTIAVQRAVERGVVVVTSAGNEGGSAWRYISTPADAPGAITVAAVNPDSSRAAFSSVGPTADGRIKPDVAAPGVNVPTASGASGYRWGSGTSFSSPLVAGVAAQMLQVNDALTPEDVQRILRETSHQSAHPDTLLGWGIIDADAAVRATEALRSSAPLQAVAALYASVSAVFPNPSTHYSTFSVDVPTASFSGTFDVFDVTGRHVTTILDGTLSPGLHTFRVFVGDLPPGVYLYRLAGSGAHQHGSFVVVH